MKIRKKANIYMADFETTTPLSLQYKISNLTEVFLFYIKEKNGLIDKLGYSLPEFFEYIKSDQQTKTIYFHNLSFDGDFIIKYLMKTKLNNMNTYDNFDIEGIPDNSFRFFANGNRIYNIQIRYRTRNSLGERKKFTIYFKCTLNLLTAGIEALGKDHGMKKQTYPDNMTSEEWYATGGNIMTPEIRKEWETYIKSDVEIMRLSFLAFEKNVINHQFSEYLYKGKIRKLSLANIDTIGGLVLKMTRNYLTQKTTVKSPKYDWIAIKTGFKINEPSFDLAYKFRAGGWTQFSPKYHNKDFAVSDGVSLDINSSYPYQMTKLLPYGELSEERPPENNRYTILEYYEIDVKEAIIKKEYKDFLILKNWKKPENPFDTKRYVNVLLNFKCYYFKDEWDIINKVYDIKIKKIKTYYATGATYLQELIDDFYKLRLENKLANKNAASTTYKTLLNSLFGKLLSRKTYPLQLFLTDKQINYLIETNTTTIRLGDKDYKIDTIRRDIKLGATIDKDDLISEFVEGLELELDGYRAVYLNEISPKPKKYINVLIGSTIASYGRCQLWNAIMAIGTEKFIYADTDSIFSNINVNKVQKIIELDDHILGAWKIEAQFSNGIILGAKRYLFELKGENLQGMDKLKIGFAGIHKDSITETNARELFQDGYLAVNAAMKRKTDTNGIYFIRADYNVKLGGT